MNNTNTNYQSALALANDATCWQERPSVGSPLLRCGYGHLADGHRGHRCSACKEPVWRTQGVSSLGGSGMATLMGTEDKKGGVAAVSAVERLLLQCLAELGCCDRSENTREPWADRRAL